MTLTLTYVCMRGQNDGLEPILRKFVFAFYDKMLQVKWRAQKLDHPAKRFKTICSADTKAPTCHCDRISESPKVVSHFLSRWQDPLPLQPLRSGKSHRTRFPGKSACQTGLRAHNSLTANSGMFDMTKSFRFFRVTCC